jgi:hypothetical protein
VKEMFKMPKKIEYALYENIGNVDLFTGRKKEFDHFLGDWYKDLEKNYAMCTAILSRRKKGKTAFLQRFFNILWSISDDMTEEKTNVIPFYYSVRDSEQNLGKFALDFFIEFVKAYTSWHTRNEKILSQKIGFRELGTIINDEVIKGLYKTMKSYVEDDDWQFMWDLASEAPAIVARANGEKIIQIVDEFQNINEYITNKRGKILSLSGTYMRVAEMREAPLIVSGSEVHWLLRIVTSLTGRFKVYNLENLPKEEALEAIEKYAAFKETVIDEEAKEKIWKLTKGDPLYIKALFLSDFNRKKDYTDERNIIEVYEKEIQQGEIYGTWMEYMFKIFNTVNKVNSKRIMLYLFQEEEEKTRSQIKKALNLPYTDEELENKLEALIKADLISQGSSAYRYAITKDKTYELFFRNKYQDEIDHFIPDIQKELRKTMGQENYIKGKFAEFLIKEKLKKPFNLKDLTENGENFKITPVEIEERKFIKTGIGNSEIDLYIRAKDSYTVYIDVKNTKARYGKRQLERWLRIVEFIRKSEEKAVFLVYSENGFTAGTVEKLKKNGVLVISE